MIRLLLVTGALALVGGHDIGGTFQSSEHELYQYLLQNYTSFVRPVNDSNDYITVKFALALVKIIDLNEKEQKLTTIAWVRMSWKDYGLTWNPKDFNISSVRIPAGQLWTPDIVLYNNADETFEYPKHVMAVVYHDGSVLFIPHMHLHSYCAVDLTRFPYDTQTCKLMFGSWTYSENLIDIQHMYTDSEDKDQPAIDMDHFLHHQEWDVVSTAGKRNTVKYPCCPETYPDMTYTLTLRRRDSHFTYMFIAPAVVLVLLVPTVFLLPAGSNEKTSLGVGILLSLVLLLVALEEILPAAHPTVPFIGQFYLTAMILVSISLLCSAVVSSAWSRAGRKGNVPKPIRIVFLNLLARLLCVRREDYIPEDDGTLMEHKLDDQLDSDPADDRARMVRNYARTIAMAEWRQLAVVLDRLFLLVFLCAAIILAVASVR